jgi:hypothetical protein
VRLKSLNQKVALVPWGDMLNHSSQVAFLLNIIFMLEVIICQEESPSLIFLLDLLISFQVEAYLDYEEISDTVILTTDRAYEPSEQVYTWNCLFFPSLSFFFVC